MEEPKDYNNRWRFTKDIPLSLVLAFAFQTLMFAWFLATQNAALNSLVVTVKELITTSYTKDEARHEREFQEQVQKNSTERVNELLRRVTILESQGQGKR